ncbi:MAG: hypothetical protein ACI4QS_12405 [Comamonas sp.]
MSSIVRLLSPFSAPRSWALGAMLGGAAFLTGCVVPPVGDGYTDYGYSSTTVYTTYGHPPPPRVEYRSVAPSVRHVWVGGDWFWSGSRYDWRPGRWAAPGYRPVMPPPPRAMVQPPRPHWNSAPPAPRTATRPAERPRPPQMQPPQRPSAPADQVRPPRQPRPDGVRGDRPQMRPDRSPPPQQARPSGPRPEQARPQPPRRGDGEGRRSHPAQRDGDDERRGRP